MIDTGNGLVPVNSSQIQHMLNRPGIPEGLPGLSVPRKARPQQPQQPRPQHMPPQQPQQYQPMPQPTYQNQNYQQPQQNWQYPPQQQPPEYWNNQPQQPMPGQGYDAQGNVMPVQQPVQQPLPRQQQARKVYPFFEQYTMDNEYHLEIDLAGIDESTLSIEYADSIVTISGYRENIINKLTKLKGEAPQEHQSNMPQHLIGKFSFDFSFKKMVDESMISADYTGGVLHVILPHRIKGEKVKIGLKKSIDV
jgi:HSP20 family molecular chaperone IbpA